MNKLKDDLEETGSLSTERYRQWFQENKAHQTFSPWIHPLFNFGILLLTGATSLYFTLEHGPLSLKNALLFPLTLLLGNLVVFLLHRFPLHRRYKLVPFPYDEHTVQHHRYFDSANVTLTGPKDFESIFFPWFIVLGFVLATCPIFYGLGYLYNGYIAGLFFVFSACFYFTLYEIVHLSCHLRRDHWWLKIPGLRAMREHHRIHHHPKLMNRYNFCIVYPLMDYILGTKFKESILPPEDSRDHYKDVIKNLD